jgi:ZIP family zinc transporter
MIQILFFSAIAGIFGTGLGGLISVSFLKKTSENVTCWILSFAGGVMISIVCFGLIPEAFDLANVTVSIFGLILGIFLVMGLNRLVDKMTITNKVNLTIHHTPEELYHEDRFIHGNSRMLGSGLLILIAIGLHNIPEGIAIGTGGSHDFQFGALLAIMIGLHNIPEGIAIAAPLLVGGIKRWKAVLLTSLAGATTLLGGFIGILLGGISDTAIAISLSAAGGAMLYVIFGEMMPQSIVMTKNRITSVITLFGIVVGLILTRV